MVELMLSSEIRTYTYGNGEILRAQCVSFDDWASLRVFTPSYSDTSFEQLCNVYSNFLVPALPIAFPKMMLFRLPEDMEAAIDVKTSDKYGRVNDKLTALAMAFSKAVKIKKGKPVFSDERLEKVYRELEKRNAVRIICGSRPKTKVIPVSNRCGFMSESETGAAVRVNASFFVMDPFDCGTLYDSVGTPFGLVVDKGEVLSPPLFNREALLVGKDGSISVEQRDIYNTEFEINGILYKNGVNCIVFERPESKRTNVKKDRLLWKEKLLKKDNLPKKGDISYYDIVIIGNRVAAVRKADRGGTQVPSSGFVARIAVIMENNGETEGRKPGDYVSYKGYENVLFAIQVGNSIVINGKRTERFISPFYNIKKLGSTEFPPSLYPLNYEESRAARIALGADKENHPCIIWAEGAGKVRYEIGTDSRGASLSDMCDICEDFGLVNAVSLDGGGSSQILYRGERYLHISDRNPINNEDAERAVPVGLMVK